IRLAPAADLWLDAQAFRALAGPPAGRPMPDPRRLAEAAAAYTDDFLAGFSLADCPAFDEWQFFQREELRQLLAKVLHALARVLSAQGDPATALAPAGRWVALDPLYEPAQRELMRLYAQAGQPAAALRQYLAYQQTLQAELRAQPQPETTELYE